MTRQEIDAVFERVKSWPEDRQAWAAYLLLDYEKRYDDPLTLSEEDLHAFDEAIAEADRGEFVSDHEAKALFDKYRV